MTASLEGGIRSFQRDEGLLEDGQIIPDGETIGALKGEIETLKSNSSGEGAGDGANISSSATSKGTLNLKESPNS
ncbi:MAG: hypothetical protein ACKVJ1_10985 [Verrucomicrobiia bacterium]|jgi:hypothetical protein